MNIQFSYLYRDGANFKRFNEIVFSNPQDRNLEEIQFSIQEKLIDGQWFVADDWKIPNQFFYEYKWDDTIDHTWHEFLAITETEKKTTENITVEELLLLVKDSANPFK